MLERSCLITFGGLRVADTAGATPALRRHALALLAYLATTSGRAVSRELLMTLLWPDSDAERARNSLRQTIFHIRRCLHQDCIQGTTELRLVGLASDVADFDAAVARRDDMAAVAVYAGAFLDGFHLSRSHEFEDWASVERERRLREFIGAARRRGQQALATGDATAAVSVLERAARIQPIDSALAAELVRAAIAAREPTIALQRAEAHVAALRTELDVGPDPELRALIQQLRSAAPPIEAPVPASPSRDTPAVPVPEHVAATTQSAIATAPIARRRHGRAVFASAALAIAVLIFVARRTALPREGGADQHWFVVAPFTVEGPPEDAFLGEGIARLVSRGLEGLHGRRAVDPAAVFLRTDQHEPNAVASRTPRVADIARVADHFGAAEFVAGDVEVRGDSALLRATFYRRRQRDSVIATAEAAGSIRDIFRLTDRLTALLAAGSFQDAHQPLVQSAMLTTSSLEAYKAFLDGEDAMSEWRFADAMKLFQRAVTLDTTFAVAYYRLSMAADWTGNSDVTRSAADGALRFANRLDDHERLLVASMQAWRHGRFDTAEDLARRVVTEWRTDADAWYQLGEILFHTNPIRGRSMNEAREPFERTVSLNPRHWDAWMHLGRLAAFNGDRAAADSLFKRPIAALPDSSSLDARVLLAFVDADATRQHTVLSELGRRSDTDVFYECTRVAAWAHDLPGAERVCAVMTTPERSIGSRATGLITIAYLQLAEGQRERARQTAMRIPREMRAWRADLLAWLECTPQFSVDTARVQAAHDSVLAIDAASVQEAAALSWWYTTPLIARPYQLARLAACIGDDAAADHWASVLKHFPGRDSLERVTAPRLSVFLAAERAWRAGHWAEAFTHLEATDSLPASNDDSMAHVLARYLRGDVLWHLGRNDEARGWLRGMDGLYAPDLRLAAAGYLRSASIARATGSAADAAADSARAAVLWRNADGDVRW